MFAKLLHGGEEETIRHFIECGELQEIRRQYGVYGTNGKALEEVLMFMEKSEELVDRCKKMIVISLKSGLEKVPISP